MGPLRRKHWARYLTGRLDELHDELWDAWLYAWGEVARTYALSQGVKIDPVTYERIDQVEHDAYGDETPLVEHVGTIDG